MEDRLKVLYDIIKDAARELEYICSVSQHKDHVEVRPHKNKQRRYTKRHVVKFLKELKSKKLPDSLKGKVSYERFSQKAHHVGKGNKKIHIIRVTFTD